MRFFGNLRRKLLGEKKLRKYLVYAAGEIFLVVVGILIALQINSWNQERQNEAELRNLLGAFAAENNLNHKVLKESIEDCKHVRSALYGLLTKMGPDYLQQSRREVDSLFFEGLSVTLYNPNTASYKNLIGSGRLKYIENDSLHDMLLEWDSKLVHLNNAEAILFDTFKNIILPHFFDKISLVGLDMQFASGYESRPPSAFNFDNRQALSSMTTENILEDHYYNMEKLEKEYKRLYADFKRINSLISMELKSE